MQAERDPFAAGAAAELGRLLLEADYVNEKRQTNVMNELDEKIARGDAGLKIAEERAARRRQLAGLVAEEQRAADVEHQTDLIMTDLEKRTANVKENIAKNEAARAALRQAEADLLKTDHRIELAEGLSADCRQLLQNLADADKADEDAAARQAEYVAAQAALDSAEEEYSTLQRQLNANRAGLLAKDLQKGKPCPVCGSTKHPKIAALPKDHITEKQLEEREKALTAQRRSTAAASRTAGDAAAHAHELRAALQRDADGFFARRGDRYTGKPAAALPPARIISSLPICRCRRASPIACVPVAQALTTLKLPPLAPTSIATTPEDMLANRLGIMNGATRLGPRSINARDCFSMVSIPPTPEPIRTPKRSGSTSPSLRLASRMASLAASAAGR